MWRSEEVKILLDYVYHPVYKDYSSDLPYSVVTSFLPKGASHPITLVPDDLLVEVCVFQLLIPIAKH